MTAWGSSILCGSQNRPWGRWLGSTRRLNCAGRTITADDPPEVPWRHAKRASISVEASDVPSLTTIAGWGDHP